jgi:hypothetical protein
MVSAMKWKMGLIGLALVIFGVWIFVVLRALGQYGVPF